MKLLCISDQIDPIVYSNSIKERFKDVDVVLCAGDLPMEYLDFIVSSLNKPTFFIFGNHNLKDFGYYHSLKTPGQMPYVIDNYDMAHSHGAVYTGFKVLTIKDIPGETLLLAGASGSIEYNHGLNQYTNKGMMFKLIRLIPRLLTNKLKYGRYLDIFLTHAPPAGIHDLNDPCHRGFDCYKWFMHKFKPTYLIHGHIHLYDIQSSRVSTFEDTTVINAYSHYLLQFNPGSNKNGSK